VLLQKQLVMLAGGHTSGYGGDAGVRETVATLRRHADPALTYRDFLHALHASYPALARAIDPNATAAAIPAPAAMQGTHPGQVVPLQCAHAVFMSSGVAQWL
jgi:hypothetical protein